MHSNVNDLIRNAAIELHEDTHFKTFCEPISSSCSKPATLRKYALRKPGMLALKVNLPQWVTVGNMKPDD